MVNTRSLTKTKNRESIKSQQQQRAYNDVKENMIPVESAQPDGTRGTLYEACKGDDCTLEAKASTKAVAIRKTNTRVVVDIRSGADQNKEKVQCSTALLEAKKILSARDHTTVVAQTKQKKTHQTRAKEKKETDFGRRPIDSLNLPPSPKNTAAPRLPLRSNQSEANEPCLTLRKISQIKTDVYKDVHRQALQLSSASSDAMISTVDESSKISLSASMQHSTGGSATSKEHTRQQKPTIEHPRVHKQTSAAMMLLYTLVYCVAQASVVYLGYHLRSQVAVNRDDSSSTSQNDILGVTRNPSCKYWERLLQGWDNLSSCPFRLSNGMYRAADAAESLGLEEKAVDLSSYLASCGGLTLLNDTNDGWLVGLDREQATGTNEL